ncbi:unnamed protein product [Prorocentrum cordatum]|uniref:Uncharacterized protein n=1 Tax=Prorocentrum cordatum TaxID=2364126 RepID=A0ABN9QKA8_9DINO|nr:unnamed protein product [Polarella glacialis]
MLSQRKGIKSYIKRWVTQPVQGEMNKRMVNCCYVDANKAVGDDTSENDTGSTCNLVLHGVTTTVGDEGGKKGVDEKEDKKGPKMDLRCSLAVRGGKCDLPFFGRVIEEGPAQHMAKQTILFLGSGNDSSPLPLYTDGSSFVNSLKSDCCIAFLVPILPIINDNDKPRDTIAEGEVASATAIAPATEDATAPVKSNKKPKK